MLLRCFCETDVSFIIKIPHLWFFSAVTKILINIAGSQLKKYGREIFIKNLTPLAPKQDLP